MSLLCLTTEYLSRRTKKCVGNLTFQVLKLVAIVSYTHETIEISVLQLRHIQD